MSRDTRPDPEASPSSRDELQPLLASARALLRELVEEGIQAFDRAPLEPARPTDAGHAAGRAGSPSDAGRRAASSPAVGERARRDGEARSAALFPDATGADRAGAAEAVPWSDHRPTLDEVRQFLGECTRCALHEGRSRIVFGDGNPEADLLFVGEGPGEQEDRQGLPFVGRAGELLTQMIEKGIGIPRREVYICNIVKCRPPGNRNPLPPEVSACRPFLDGQIQAVAPRVIVTLGKPAASLLLGRDIAITRLRGTWQSYRGIPLMPTLHPAYVLRQYTPENRRAVWEDLKAAWARCQEPG